MKNIKATSLVEVIIASLILAIVFAGLVAGFISVRKYIARSQKRLTGTNISRENFSMLAGDVNAVTWDTGNLAVAAPAPLNLPVDGVTYAGNRTVTTPAGVPDYRQVTVNVNFPVD
jgi:Tfp pilus assembly protein PilW